MKKTYRTVPHIRNNTNTTGMETSLRSVVFAACIDFGETNDDNFLSLFSRLLI